MQTAVKRSLGKGNPLKKYKVTTMSFFCGEVVDTKKRSAWIQGRKQLQALLRTGNCFSVRCPLSLEALTLSFLLLTCTSSNITQALRKIHEWLIKQMLLNEKLHTACSSLSQYSYVDKKQINLYIHLLLNTVRKKSCFV